MPVSVTTIYGVKPTMPVTSPAAVVRQLEILAVYCFDLADRAAAGMFSFNLAVDFAYEAAVWADLPDAVDAAGLIDSNLPGAPTGDDIVRAVIAAAFASARRPR
jgi:hypothetical protein